MKNSIRLIIKIYSILVSIYTFIVIMFFPSIMYISIFVSALLFIFLSITMIILEMLIRKKVLSPNGRISWFISVEDSLVAKKRSIREIGYVNVILLGVLFSGAIAYVTWYIVTRI